MSSASPIVGHSSGLVVVLPFFAARQQVVKVD